MKFELARVYGSAYGKRNVYERGFRTPQIFPDHLSARAMRDIVGIDVWSQIFTFALVRNPWDRVLSLYHWRRKVGGIPYETPFREYVYRLYRRHETDDGWFSNPVHWMGAADFILDEDGRVIVDYVGRFEAREASLAVIRRITGLSELGRSMLQSASPQGSRYVEAYDGDTEAIIRELYATDIELFGYEFGVESLAADQGALATRIPSGCSRVSGLSTVTR